MYIRPYQKLIAWQEAHKLCVWVCKVTETFPSREQFRLVDQICRSAQSVPTNIAEGSGKTSKKERRHYYEIAACSLEELHYQCFLAREFKYMTDEQMVAADSHINRVSYLISRLRESIRTYAKQKPSVPLAPLVPLVPSATPVLSPKKE